ncbi:hypothetical protein LTR62_004144 [Meristemomyces frigidus]|uniref:RRM domain-containing protein n=1 Tax=Meristemomyces frigidus TaxID=1508187 RepID=A0AAN7YKM4_9PEZI|nr:hypothetical protein LTR62_004144 [Meristemomyces frigidus]
MSDTAPIILEQAIRTRLHITPFNPDLLDRYISSTLQPQTSNISFHTLETFPEKGFGYVELPVMEAEKLKKKFNGTTLRGAKVRIEDAKPANKRKSDVAVEDEGERKERKKAKKEKRKREEGVLEGHELESGRHVKRGWTEGGAEKKSSKKKEKDEKAGDIGIEGKKMLFKTSIPPNAIPVKEKSKKESQEKQVKADGKSDSRTKTKAVVQEGKKSSKLVGAAGKGGKEKLRYVDEQGWVDESGSVVEEARKSSRPKKEKKVVAQAAPAVQPVVAAAENNEEDSVDSGDLDESSSEDPSSDEDVDEEVVQTDTPAAKDVPSSPATEDQDAPTTPAEMNTNLPSPTANPSAEKEVHPLEALFKRPAPSAQSTSASKPKPSPIDTSFSFFNSGAAEEDAADEQQGDAVAHPPQTPHTQRDMEWRSIRSAAPTPDTAAIGKRFSFPPPDTDMEDDDSDDDDEDEEAEIENGIAEAINADLPTSAKNGEHTVAGAQEGGEREESAFRKWFYEHRGDLNRGWKKRRREERKAKRQRENKRAGRRVA